MAEKRLKRINCIQSSKEESLWSWAAREFQRVVKFSEAKISDSRLHYDSGHCEGLRAPFSKACRELLLLMLSNNKGKGKATRNDHLSSFFLPDHDFYTDRAKAPPTICLVTGKCFLRQPWSSLSTVWIEKCLGG